MGLISTRIEHVLLWSTAAEHGCEIEGVQKSAREYERHKKYCIGAVAAGESSSIFADSHCFAPGLSCVMAVPVRAGTAFKRAVIESEAAAVRPCIDLRLRLVGA